MAVTGASGTSMTDLDSGKLIYRAGLDRPEERDPCAATGGLPERSGVEAWLRLAVSETKRLQPAAQVEARLIAFEQHVRILRPDGSEAVDRRRGCRVRIEARVVTGSELSAAVGEAVLVAPPGVEDPRSSLLVAETAGRLTRRLRARAVPPGQRPVVFAPGTGGVLIHELVGHALESDTFHGGMSWLSGLGSDDRPGPVDMTVVDDPRRGRGRWKLDDFGEPAVATPLIMRGRIAGCLESLQSARAHGKRPTGHSRRASYRRAALPRMGCTFLAAGPYQPEEVLDGIDDGIYVRRMESASTDPLSGVAIFRVTDADRIVGGRLEAPLRPHLLRVSGRESLAQIDRIADDVEYDRCIGSCVRDGQPVVTSVGAPTFRIGLATVFC